MLKANALPHTLEKLFKTHSNINYNTCQVLLKTLDKDFSISCLSDKEKDILSEIISCRWVSKKEDEIIHNFSVFTKAQEQELSNIFDEMYNELKSVIQKIFVEIEKFCRADLPKHLVSYLNYHIYMTFCEAMKITTGFAYYDGKIYDPKDEIECGMLTFHVINNISE